MNKRPTYEEIKAGTQKESELPELNELFCALNAHAFLMVTVIQSNPNDILMQFRRLYQRM